MFLHFCNASIVLKQHSHNTLSTLTLKTSPYWVFPLMLYIQTMCAVLRAWKSNCPWNEEDQSVCISRAVSCTVRSDKYSAGWVIQSALKNNGRRSAYPLPGPQSMHCAAPLYCKKCFPKRLLKPAQQHRQILERVGLHTRKLNSFIL